MMRGLIAAGQEPTLRSRQAVGVAPKVNPLKRITTNEKPGPFRSLTVSLLTEKRLPHKVSDISLAELGRRRIMLAENEMPGLMSLRKKYGTKKETFVTTKGPDTNEG